MIRLSTSNHDRDIAGLTYIYPVISRRAGGLSIGINFNTNNACNWRCIYCQVPNLKLGNAPDIDFELLEQEFRFFLNYVQQGDFFQHYQIPEPQRIIKDLAISGNGEASSVKNFAQAIGLLGNIAKEFGLFPNSKFVLISNGSLIQLANVQAGLVELAKWQGELWFKLDSASEQGRKLINNTGQTQQKLLRNLETASQLCHTKIQTCMLNYRQQIWTANEKQAYLDLLTDLKQKQLPIQQIMLYSLARESFQAESSELTKMSGQTMHEFAEHIQRLGFDVSVSE